MESIFFFLASFIFSSILHMDVGPMTFLYCTFLHIIAGFFDPAFLNTNFVTFGQILGFVFQLIEYIQDFPFWIPKVRNRPRKLFSQWFRRVHKRIFPGFYSKNSLLDNIYLRKAKIHLIEDNTRISGSVRRQIFRAGRKSSAETLKIRNFKETHKDNNINFSMVSFFYWEMSKLH